MRRSLLLAACLTPLVSAWTYSWSNSTDGTTIERSDKNPQTCKHIYLEEGYPFHWDPEGAWCIEVWKDADCTNRGGWSCDGNTWGHNSTQNITAFDVYRQPTSSTTSGSATLSPSTASTNSASSSAAAADSSSNTSSSNSLSGGAIAGIVIGCLAGLALIAALFFILGRRRRHNNAAAAVASNVSHSPAPDPYLPPEAPDTNSISSRTNTMNAGLVVPRPIPLEGEKPPMYSAESPVQMVSPLQQNQPVAGSRMVELVDTGVSELADTSLAAELEGPLKRID